MALAPPRGHISAYSEQGLGTTFRLFFPRAAADHDRDIPAVPAALARGGGETILAVEDNPSLRLVVARQLKELGYRVLEADDAHKALRILHSETVDLLFTDIVMPGVAFTASIEALMVTPFATVRESSRRRNRSGPAR